MAIVRHLVGNDLRACTAVYVYSALDFVWKAMDPIGLERCGMDSALHANGKAVGPWDIGRCDQGSYCYSIQELQEQPRLHTVGRLARRQDRERGCRPMKEAALAQPSRVAQ